MRIIYSHHAKKRMIERDIKEKDIIDAIDLPDYIITRQEEIEAYKNINNRTLKVVYIPMGKFINIIPVYYL